MIFNFFHDDTNIPLQAWQVFIDYRPDNIQINPEVMMADFIACTRDFTPLYPWIFNCEFYG